MITHFFEVAVFSAILAGAQAYGFSLGGIIPNLGLIAIALAAYEIRNMWEGVVILLITSMILKFTPGFSYEAVVFSAIGIFMLLARTYLPWYNLINITLLILLGTFLWYVILGSQFLGSAMFFKELLINVSLGIILFVITSYVWQNDKKPIARL